MSVDSNMVHKNEGFNRLPSKLGFAASSAYVTNSWKSHRSSPSLTAKQSIQKEKDLKCKQGFFLLRLIAAH